MRSATAGAAPGSETQGYYRWTVLGVGTAAQAAFSTLQGGIPSLGPFLRGELGLSLPEVGVVLGSVSWGLVLSLFAWGWIADRVGARLVISLGLAGSSAALAGVALVPGKWELIGGLMLAGALGGSAPVAGTSVVLHWFGRHERALALGFRQMAVPLGGAVGALVLPLLVGAGGLRAALLGLAAAEAVAAAGVVIWLRDPAPAGPLDRQQAGPSPLRDGRVWRLSTGSALLVCSQIALLTFVVLFLHDRRGMSTPRAAGVLAAIQLGGAAARLVSGRLSDRRGRRIIPLRRMAAATAVAMAATALLTHGPLFALVPALLTAGILSTGWNGLSATATVELAGHNRAGTAIGLQQTVMRAVGTAAAVGFGGLVAASSWWLGYAVFGLLALMGWWVLGPLVRDEELKPRE